MTMAEVVSTDEGVGDANNVQLAADADINITSSSSPQNNNNAGPGLRWINLSVSTGKNTKKAKKTLLHPSHGFIPSGHMCGVIGPSGAGKSTFLSVLGGTTPHSSNIHLTGSVWLTEAAEEAEETDTATNLEEDDDAEVITTHGDATPMNTPIPPSSSAPLALALKASYLSHSDGEVAMLQQDDSFFSMLTARETIELAAFLQLPGHQRKKERKHTVNTILESLGLKAHQHRRIGERVTGGTSTSKGGLSGGERRRLSVGVELVTAPKVFLADEATTGLDSTQAEKVVALMQRTARERNIPCIATLHQPRASIWRLLDMVILVSPGGRMCYIGARDEAVPYFSNLGYQCPPETNPAEFLIDLVSIDHEDPVQAERDDARISFLASTFADQTVSQDHLQEGCWRPPAVKSVLWQNHSPVVAKKRKGARESTTTTTNTRRVGVLRRFFVLVRRAWRQNIRDSKLNVFRLLASVGQAYLFSQIFRTVTHGLPTAKSIADRTALLSFGVINMSMVSCVSLR
jgi:ABC-type multidrug transport system ATPase subunit